MQAFRNYGIPAAPDPDLAFEGIARFDRTDGPGRRVRRQRDGESCELVGKCCLHAALSRLLSPPGTQAE